MRIINRLNESWETSPRAVWCVCVCVCVSSIYFRVTISLLLSLICRSIFGKPVTMSVCSLRRDRVAWSVCLHTPMQVHGTTATECYQPLGHCPHIAKQPGRVAAPGTAIPTLVYLCSGSSENGLLASLIEWHQSSFSYFLCLLCRSSSSFIQLCSET